MENSQGKNGKINKLFANILTDNITELNELIYAGAKLVYEKIGVSLKNTNEKSKPKWKFDWKRR